VSCYPPSTGPLSEYTYHLAQYLSADSRIARITILANRVEGGEEWVRGKTHVIRCWQLDDVLAPLSIVKRILDVKPDVVQFNLVFRHFSRSRLINFLGLCTPAACKLFRIPVVVTLHSIAEAIDLTQVGYSNSIANGIGYRMATRFLLMADLVTLTHQRFVDTIRRNYGAKNVVFVPHGVLFKPLSRSGAGGKKILLFGKMGAYKNPTIVLEAFREVWRMDPETELVIAGPPHPLNPRFFHSTFDGYRKSPNVRITGYVPENELEELFTSSSVVVLPYTISTWSSGVFSLACTYGRPVIASDLSDFKELVNEGAGIILFRQGDKKALAQSMELLIHDERLQLRLGEANLRWAERHSFDKVVGKMIQIFENLARKEVKPKPPLTAHNLPNLPNVTVNHQLG
jgi:glycosyltransferase involved in cell wall biosynthesis